MKNISIFVFCVILKFNEISAEINDTIVQDPSVSFCNSTWDELLPSIKMMKSTSHTKTEKLLNVAQLINHLLMKNIEKDVMLDEIRTTNKPKNSIKPECDSIVDEILTPLSDTFNTNNCIVDNAQNKTPCLKNCTADLDKIFKKISAALEKFEACNQNRKFSKDLGLDSFQLTPIFRSSQNKCECKLKQPLLDTPAKVTRDIKSTELNYLTSGAFSIPCQKAADILTETATFKIPKCAYCDDAINNKYNFIHKNSNLHSDNSLFEMMPNTINCVESDSSVAVLFKPKTITMTQYDGALLKKMTTNVLVPYHVTKLAF